MKVLHITNWFPSKENLRNALWIKRQIGSLPVYIKSEIIHFEIIPSNRISIKKKKTLGLKQLIISCPVKFWILIELIYLFWLFYQFKLKKVHKGYDIINFHIAYPMLTYWHLISKNIKKPIVINEHWSAYHFNFGVNNQLPRVQRIFKQNIPVIAVSNSLKNDLIDFSDSIFPYYIVPNIVDDKIFFPPKTNNRKDYFFMVSNWKTPKTPLLLMKAFLLSQKESETKLIVGGFGPLWDDMIAFVSQEKVENRIKLIGTLSSKEIAVHMQNCKAFVHSSDYETFSVVCAEAVACGAYVLAPNVGGIPEVVGKNGSLVSNNTLTDWVEALSNIPNHFKSDYNSWYSQGAVGLKYESALTQIYNDFKR